MGDNGRSDMKKHNVAYITLSVIRLSKREVIEHTHARTSARTLSLSKVTMPPHLA